MTNPLRGELEVTLAGTPYKTRLTIDGMIRLEQQLGQGIITFAQRMSQGDVSIGDAIKVLLIAIRGGGNKMEEAELKRIVFDHGLANSLAVVGEIITNALVGGQNEGNVEAVES